MAVDIPQVQFSSTIDTFKGVEPDVTGEITVPSQSYSASQTRNFSTTIALDRTDATTQILFEYSFRSGRWYAPRGNEDFQTNFRAFCFFSTSGDTLTATCTVWNADGVSSHSLTGFSVAIVVKKFVAPFGS